jgi:hypothetical protein
LPNSNEKNNEHLTAIASAAVRGGTEGDSLNWVLGEAQTSWTQGKTPIDGGIQSGLFHLEIGVTEHQ